MAADRDLKDMVHFLKVHGLWYKFDGKYGSVLQILQHIRLIYFGGVFPWILVSLFQVEFKGSLSKYAFLASGGFYVLIKALSYFANQRRTEVLVRRLANIHRKRTEPWQHELFFKYSDTIWKFVYLYGLMAVFYMVSYFVIPLLYDIYLMSSEKSKEPFNFPFPLEVLANKERSVSYYSLLLVTFLWNSFLLSYGLGSLAVLWVIVSYCCVDIQILCRLTIEFGKDANNVQKMGRIVKDYLDILELFQDMKQIIGLPLAGQNAVGSLLLTIFLYSTKIQLKEDVMLLIVNLFSLAAMTTIMFFACFTGEILQTESIKLYKTFCELPWYKMTPGIRRSLSFLILASSKPMVIDYKGKLALNLQTFMQMMNSCYSYFMLLNSMN